MSKTLDVTPDELQVILIESENALDKLGEILKSKGSQAEFMELIAFIEAQMVALKAGVIRNSRAHKKGVKKDGSPDRRFAANRSGRAGGPAGTPARPDLRVSRAG